jgi:hypothetical protein
MLRKIQPMAQAMQKAERDCRMLCEHWTVPERCRWWSETSRLAMGRMELGEERD